MTISTLPPKGLALTEAHKVPTIPTVGAELISAERLLLNGEAVGTLVKYTQPPAWPGTTPVVRWSVLYDNPYLIPRAERTRPAAIRAFLGANTNLLVSEIAALVKGLGK